MPPTLFTTTELRRALEVYARDGFTPGDVAKIDWQKLIDLLMQLLPVILPLILQFFTIEPTPTPTPTKA